MNTVKNKSTQRAQTPPRTKGQLRVIRDSNLDFQINPDPDVYQITRQNVDSLPCRRQSLHPVL